MRRSGVLLPIASLPSPYGIGDFGPQAFRFLDWLHTAGQRVWGILPLLIPDETGSPFASSSAFALNWMLVSPEQLVADKLLPRTYLPRKHKPKTIDYGATNSAKRILLGYSWHWFQSHGSKKQRAAFTRFCKQESSWLDDYSLYMAIKDRSGGKPWWRWPAPLRDRKPAALATWRRNHAYEIAYFAYGQWVAHEQWQRIRNYGRRLGIRILGDLPFYVTHDSVDVWAHRELFQVTRPGALSRVSGAPPDMYFPNGQVWGNPLYDWQKMRRTKFRWWVARGKQAARRYDIIRLDHFRGYEAVWTIPLRGTRPGKGSWRKAPGGEMFRRLFHFIPASRFVAEDLGKTTPSVFRLRDRFRLPGMRILQFGFHRRLGAVHHPSVYPAHSLAYSGTHDMPTLRGWWTHNTSVDERVSAIASTSARPPQPLHGLLTALFNSKSATVIVQVQDVPEVPTLPRTNTPGTHTGNWSWHLRSALTIRAARNLQKLTRAAHR